MNSVRQIVWSLDPNVVLVEPQIFQAVGFSLGDMMQGLVYGKQELAALAFGTCALLGFALAIIGLFSVMTYTVALKTHDIGIRLSLGASQGTILQMTVRQGLVLTSAGIAIGLLASVEVTHFLSTQFRGISATDLLMFVVVVLAVMLVGLSACVLHGERLGSSPWWPYGTNNRYKHDRDLGRGSWARH